MSEKLCTSSIASAAGITCSSGAPSASPTASEMTGRTRLPPISTRPYRADSAWPCSSGQSFSAWSSSSTTARSSSGLCGIAFRFALRALQLLLDRLRQLGELAEDLERALGGRVLVGRDPVELGPRRLDALQQLLGPVQRFVGHAAISRTMRPSIPLTSLPASSEAY